MSENVRTLFDIWADISYNYWKILQMGVPISEHTREMTVLLKELKNKVEEITNESITNF